MPLPRQLAAGYVSERTWYRVPPLRSRRRPTPSRCRDRRRRARSPLDARDTAAVAASAPWAATTRTSPGRGSRPPTRRRSSSRGLNDSGTRGYASPGVASRRACEFIETRSATVNTARTRGISERSMPLIVCRYHEITLKRGNRARFAGQLVDNLRRVTADLPIGRIADLHGRIVLVLREESGVARGARTARARVRGRQLLARQEHAARRRCGDRPELARAGGGRGPRRASLRVLPGRDTARRQTVSADFARGERAGRRRRQGGRPARASISTPPSSPSRSRSFPGKRSIPWRRSPVQVVFRSGSRDTSWRCCPAASIRRWRPRA